ncbi:MAG: flagellar export chaperone FliS [Spirochaetes bacterium]|nr:flagellar export chaperone FliS [Spirochaetota bacterium]
MQEDRIAHYRETQIKTASQGKLVVILYDGLLRFLDLALENLPKKKYDLVNNNIIRAQDILSELSMSLNMEAGDISQRLLSIYSFLNMKLIEGNVQKSEDQIRFVRRMVSELRESWNKIAKKSSITPIEEMKKGGIDVAG